MPYLPNNANIFGDLMRRPDIAANWFQGAMAPNAYEGNLSPDQETMMLGTQATGEPVTSEPRQGLFPQLLAHAGLISPDIHADQRTQYMEQILLQRMKEEDAQRRSAAIDHYTNFVKEVGGDRAAEIGPKIFSGLVDPSVFESLRGVPSTADMLDKRLQQQETLQSQRMDEQSQREQSREDAHWRELQATLGGRQDIAGDRQRTADAGAITKAFTGGLVSDPEGWKRAMATYNETGDVIQAIQSGLHQSVDPNSHWIRDMFTNMFSSSPAKADPAKKAAALKALGIGSGSAPAGK